jgi:hypothetical protein
MQGGFVASKRGAMTALLITFYFLGAGITFIFAGLLYSLGAAIGLRGLSTQEYIICAIVAIGWPAIIPIVLVWGFTNWVIHKIRD